MILPGAAQLISKDPGNEQRRRVVPAAARLKGHFRQTEPTGKQNDPAGESLNQTQAGRISRHKISFVSHTGVQNASWHLYLRYELLPGVFSTSSELFVLR